MHSARLKINLLGDFQLLSDGKVVSGLNADRPQTLLAYLLLHRHAPQSRQHLAFLLWPDSSESQARTNLRNLLFTLRHMLPDADLYLLSDNMTVQWNAASSFELDVADFEEMMQKARTAENDAALIATLEQVVNLYKGDLLPGNYDDWLINIREEIRQQYLRTLSQLVSLLENSADYQRAVLHSRRLWQQDTLDEATAVQHMRLLALSGDRAGVQRVYQTLVSSLKRELDVEPSAVTREAYLKYRHTESNQGERAVLTEIQEWRPRPLPIPATPFIGREKELADIAERLADPDCRLLTLVGLSGMGKTRLVLQAAKGHQAIFRDGAAFASLAAANSADLFIRTIADVLSVKLSDAGNPWSQLIAALNSKHLLLVLDNIDHVLFTSQEKDLYEIQQFLDDLLQSAPDLKMIVTSHRGLDLAGEWVYEIQGLPIPHTTEDLDLTNSSSVMLFVNSARRVDSQFVVSDQDLQAIIRICSLVDGMPLGIELAASWVRLLTCAEIEREITQSINFLRTELRNIPPRHRSMRAIFDHSWELLSSKEKEVLARLSAFSCVFSRETAERDAGADLDTLSGLVNKSLLCRVGAGQFKLHNLVRQYAAQRLNEGAAAAHFSLNGHELLRTKVELN